MRAIPTRLSIAVLVLVWSTSATASAQEAAQAKPRFELKDGDRVVLLGNTLIERAQKYGYWETMLTARWPERKIVFRNLGWSGDTVWAESRNLFDLPDSRDKPSKGYQRMLEHVGRIKPTVILLGYGNNEAHEGEKGLAGFVRQYEKLVDDLTRVSARGVRFVVLHASLYPGYDERLGWTAEHAQNIVKYDDAVLTIARRRGFVSITPFMILVPDPNDPNKSKRVDPPTSAFDGIHLSEDGYRISAGHIQVQLSNVTPQPVYSPMLAFEANGKSLGSGGFDDFEIEKREKGFRFSTRRTELTEAGLTVMVRGLPDGRYTLKIDGKPVRTDDAKNWWNVTDAQAIGPDAQQFEKLCAAVVAKNRLYFHSWRPQNTTYLFGFRKHEQGQNAKEVAEFAKLVAEKEREIDRLKKPVKRTYEFVRVKKDNE